MSDNVTVSGGFGFISFLILCSTCANTNDIERRLDDVEIKCKEEINSTVENISDG